MCAKGVMFVQDSQKTSNFLKAISRCAKEQQKEIQAINEALKKQELEHAETQVLQESYAMIQREMDQMRKNVSKKVLEVEREGQKELFEKRHRIMESIFLQAKKALCEYTNTPEYREALKCSAGKAFKVINASVPSRICVFVRPDDQRYAQDIQDLCNGGCQVLIDDTIQIGGLRAENKSFGVTVDETLDAKLDVQRDWFFQNCGMSIL